MTVHSLTGNDVLSNPRSGSCILCGAPAIPFFELGSVPINVSELHFDRQAAATARLGRIALAFCSSCGAVFNYAWNPALLTYGRDYENSLDASKIFGEYSASLAGRLAATYPFAGRKIVEIGCGQARFLQLVCELIGCPGEGYDPSYIGPGSRSGLTIRPRLFQPEDGAGAGLVICRHVLEHLDDPRTLLERLARTAASDQETILYFEVPNAASIFDGGIPWDIIYPHISYFTLQSITRLFSSCGFRILASGTAYSGQFLYVEAAMGGASRGERALHNDLPSSDLISGFPRLLSSIIDKWADFLRGAAATGQRIAFWGAGAKGVTFLNTVPHARDIGCVIDLNPRKQGSFVPGTGQLICGPETLRDFNPDVVIASNPIYSAEIRHRLAALDLHLPLLTDLPPDGGFPMLVDNPVILPDTEER